MNVSSPGKFKLSFQTKVLVPVLAFLILLPTITVWMLDRHIGNNAREEAIKTLTTVRAVFRDSLDQRERSLEVRFGNMVNEPRFKAIAQLGDSGTMQAFLNDLLEDLSSEVQIILYTPLSPTQSSSSVHRTKLFQHVDFETTVARNVQSAMEGELRSNLLVYKQNAYNLVSVPLRMGENSASLGVLTLALKIGQSAVNDLKSLTRTEVILYAGNKWIAGTLDRSRLAENEDLFFRGFSTISSEVRPFLIDGEHFHILSGQIANNEIPGDPFGYILLLSYEERLQVMTSTRITLLAVSAIGIITSVTIIMLLVRNLTKPLRELRDGAEAVGRGDFSKRVNISSTDECGDLADAFNQMTSNLQSSREQLETNVRELQNTQKQLIQREQRLRESEEGLRLIIEGARDHVIFTIDEQRNIQRWNSAAERMLGYNSDEVKQLDYEKFFDEQDRNKNSPGTILEEASRNGRAAFEGWRVGKDGKRFWADVTLSRLEQLPGSEGGGFVEIARDITARKSAEEALVEARNAAEASNRAKNEFMGNMSHEIRTPMNGIIGMTSLLLEEELNEEQRDLTETIRTSADSLLAIIDDILDISKIEAGRLEITAAPVNLIELLEITADSFAHVCAEKNLELTICIGPQVPSFFETDPTRVRQVLSNLIGNAVKFTENGEIRIDMRYNPAESQLAFSVKDTGIGVPENKISQLFTPFFQVESTNSRRFGGTGLGLSICKRIASLLGGKIEVKSALGEGSTFTFGRTASPMKEEDQLTCFPNKSILLLTNNARTRSGICDQILNWNAQVKPFGLSSESIAPLVKESAPDLVILDDSAPQPLDGVEVVMETLADSLPPWVRILAHNTKASSNWPGKGVTLHKPVQPTELNGALAKLLINMDTVKPGKFTQLTSRKELEDDFAEMFPYKPLVVEDNSINAKVLVTILKRLGYEPEVAGNGEECLMAMRQTKFDIVFMDLQMPVMDGYQAALRIFHSDTIDYPVFVTAFTANARQDDRDACAAAGMHDFVPKPARPQKIKDVIRRAHDWFNQMKVSG